MHLLPAVEAASLIHTGGYDGLTGAYGALTAWTQSHGYRTSAPSREVYLQGPAVTQPGSAGSEPTHYVTEVLYPLQPRSDLRPKAREDIRMEPRIVTKEAFNVVGIPFSGQVSSSPYEDGQNNNEIGKAWDQFNARAAEIKHWSGPAIGLCFGMPDADEPWNIAGAEVSTLEDVPVGMMGRHVPAAKYAVFQCTLPTLGATYQYIMEQWQPASGYERGEGPDFEVYDESWDMDDELNSPMYVYWPVK
jgi:AraC family transcriptional regulator